MNPVEIEQAISDLAEAPFDAAEFPYAFLEAFGRKETEIKKLRKGDSNKSDLGGVLQRNNIHIATCAPGEVSRTLAALKASPATAKHKAKFILATDGQTFEAEDLIGGDTVACAYPDFPDSFGVFLPLAGISTIKQIKESAFDIKATGRLNRLYMELLKDNPEWGKVDRRPDMNHFMARLIFCFFAEDTDIFASSRLFTGTIEQMSNRDGTNTHEIISEIFRAMNVPLADRADANLPRWADAFPYVNGGLFSGSTDVPRFSKIAQRYLSHIGGLDWTRINPDIFGSMIQAVADEDERSVLGMHYTSVPNILKVLNPLFLDDLNAALEEAGDNARKLLNLRNRIAKIRVFDPACGSGNFLVIAYKQLRAIEAEINRRRGEADRKTDIPLTNFRGIEIRDFSAEIARLALIIAEFQCDVTYRGQKEALAEFLPLDSQNWITCGNALRLDWLSICPPTGTGVKFYSEDLFQTPLDQAQIDFENEGGETYICGNPPYRGTKNQSDEQKEDMAFVFSPHTESYKSLDYVACWFLKAAQYSTRVSANTALVSTNSICQGGQVPLLWPVIFSLGSEILFAHTSFLWSNLASHNAGVTVAVIGFGPRKTSVKRIFSTSKSGEVIERTVPEINAYLVPGRNIIVDKMQKPRSGIPKMSLGNQPYEGNFLTLDGDEYDNLDLDADRKSKYFRRFYGSSEFIRGGRRFCIWLPEEQPLEAFKITEISDRVERVRKWRLASTRPATRAMAARPHQFCEMNIGRSRTIIVPIRSSENREYLPVGVLEKTSVVSNLAYALYDAPIWCVSIIASQLHLIWIATVCGRMKTDYSYSNKMGWNTFPIPVLTEKNREDLTRCAEDILLAREAHFPATIADLYDPEKMPANLRAAHDRNDETLERIYIGRRFKNDTERLEKLFDMYTKMTTKVAV